MSYTPTSHIDSRIQLATGSVEFYSSGIWTVPQGITKVRLYGCGGGGGGGAGSGGGGAGAIPFYAEVSVNSSEEITITIGAGGIGGRYTAGLGLILATNGGNTEFGNYVRFFGGRAGTSTTAGTTGNGFGTFTSGGTPTRTKGARSGNGQSSNFVTGSGGTGGIHFGEMILFGGGGGGGGSIGRGGDGCHAIIANGILQEEVIGTSGGLGAGGGGGGSSFNFVANTPVIDSGDGGQGFLKIWW